MKFKVLLVTALFMLMPIGTVSAQNKVTVIETLDIDIWPDYDQPSVLVLLTGKLPENTPLPVSITLPLPEAARLNAVARIDQKDGRMKDDIFSSTDPPGMVTFITPDPRFRVEYYFPYAISENQHSFKYIWVAPIGVSVFRIAVQQPTSASTFEIEPGTTSITRGNDGFEYHTLPSRAVEAWEPFSLSVKYNMANTELSKKSTPPPITSTKPVSLPSESGTAPGVQWALVAVIIGGLIIFGILIWQVFSRPASLNGRKAVESPVQKRSGAKFCPNCGEENVAKGKFCNECGHKL